MQRASPVDSEFGSTGMKAGSSSGEGFPRTILLRRVLVIVLIVVVVTGFFAAAYLFYFFGFALGPGTCGDVTFTADQTGSFLVYCNISCTIHLFMQNGRLNVNP